MELVTTSTGTSADGLPEGWETKTLGQIALLGGGVSASRAQLSDRGHRYLHYGDIHVTDRTHVHAHDHYDHRPRLDVPLGKVKASALLRDGDVVFVDASEDAEGVSRYVVVSNPNDVPFVSGLHTIVATGLTDSFDPLYLRYAFQADDIRDQFRFYAAGAKVSGMSKSNLAKVVVRIPPRAEQEAMAAVLSDIDALVESLNTLIAKKRALKTGTMQRLLTGRQRLAGFSGEWELRKLGELGDCLRGVSYNGSEDLSPSDTDSTKRLLRSNNVQDATIVTNDVQFVDEARVSDAQLMRRGDILVCTANGSRDLVGKAARFEVSDGYDYTFGAFMGCFRTDPERASPLYASYLFQSDEYRRQLDVLLAGSSINNLKPSAIEGTEYSLPERDEQEAISAVLSDMDAEIVALEARRDKTRQLREGMMQELLTGRTRLV